MAWHSRECCQRRSSSSRPSRGYVAAGLPGALAITAGMFLPAFAFSMIFFERLEAVVENPALHRVLAGVAAAVVGVIAATLLQLGWSTAERTTNLLLSALLFCGGLLAVWRWKRKKLTAPALVLAGGIAGSGRCISDWRRGDDIRSPRQSGRHPSSRAFVAAVTSCWRIRLSPTRKALTPLCAKSLAVGMVRDAAFADEQGAGRNAFREAFGCAKIGFEGSEVAVVHPDQPRFEPPSARDRVRLRRVLRRAHPCCVRSPPPRFRASHRRRARRR